MAVIDIPKNFFNHDAQAGGFFPKTHTNPGFDINKFIGIDGQNYLLEGIRGTGKTHILKMINENCLQSYNDLKILPVYISLASVSEYIDRDISLFRIHLYANVVLATISSIEKNRDKIELAGNSAIKKELKRLIQMFGLNSDENFELILQKLKYISTQLIDKLVYNPSEILMKDSESNKEDVEFGAKGKYVNISFQEYLERLEEQEVKYVGQSLSHENASSFIIAFFQQLKSILRNNYTYILIDECSEVSKCAQIEVFRFLKLVRGALTDDPTHNFAYFCASVYPTPVTYYPSKMNGDSFNFDVGHDAIVEYLNLDELSDEYLDFFKELTKKRIEEFIKDSLPKSYNYIFENERAFVLAAYCANGNVRRYIEILKHAYDSLCQRDGETQTQDRKKISIRDIELSIDIVVSNQILAMNKLSPTDFEIIDDISGRVAKRNKKTETENKTKPENSRLPANLYFTVSRNEYTQLGNLILQGAVHDKGKTRLKKYHKEDGTRGMLILLDLAVAFYEGTIERMKASEIYSSDLKKNAKSGFLWCQDFQIIELPK